MTNLDFYRKLFCGDSRKKSLLMPDLSLKHRDFVDLFLTSKGFWMEDEGDYRCATQGWGEHLGGAMFSPSGDFYAWGNKGLYLLGPKTSKFYDIAVDKGTGPVEKIFFSPENDLYVIHETSLFVRSSGDSVFSKIKLGGELRGWVYHLVLRPKGEVYALCDKDVYVKESGSRMFNRIQFKQKCGSIYGLGFVTDDAYAYSEKGLFVMKNGGSSFSLVLSADKSGPVHSFRLGPAGEIYAGGMLGVFEKKPQSRKFLLADSEERMGAVHSIQFGPANEVYACCSDGLFLREQGQNSFSRIHFDEDPGPVNYLLFGPNREIYADCSNGLFISYPGSTPFYSVLKTHTGGIKYLGFSSNNNFYAWCNQDVFVRRAGTSPGTVGVEIIGFGKTNLPNITGIIKVPKSLVEGLGAAYK